MNDRKELIKNTYDYYRLKLKENIVENNDNPSDNINIFNPNILELDENNISKKKIDNIKFYYENGIEIFGEEKKSIFKNFFFKDSNDEVEICKKESFIRRYNFLSNHFSLDYQDNLDNYNVVYDGQLNDVIDDHISNNRFKNFRFWGREIKPTYGKEKIPFYHFNSKERNDFFNFINNEDNMVSVLTATTGSGKTSEIPLYLLEFGFSKFSKYGDKKILITQPRRLAASNPSYYASYQTDMPRRIIYEDYEYNLKKIKSTETYAYSIEKIYKFLKMQQKFDFNSSNNISKYENINSGLLEKFLNEKKYLKSKKALGHHFEHLIGSEDSMVIFTHPTENIYDIIEYSYYIPEYECFLKKDDNLLNDNNEKILIEKEEIYNILDKIQYNIEYGNINNNLYFKYLDLNSNPIDKNYYLKKNYWDFYDKNQEIITFKINNSRIVQKLNNDKQKFTQNKKNIYEIGSLSNGFCYYKNNKKKEFYLFQNSFYTNIQIEYECEKITKLNDLENIDIKLKARYVNEYDGDKNNFDSNIVIGSSFILLPDILYNVTLNNMYGKDNTSAFNYYPSNKKYVPVDSNIIYINELNQVVEPYNTLDKKVQNEITRLKIKYRTNEILKNLEFKYDNKINREIFDIYYKKKELLKQFVKIYRVDGIFFVTNNNGGHKEEFELYLQKKIKNISYDININKKEETNNIYSNLLPFIRVYDDKDNKYKYKYSKIHRLKHNFNPDIKINANKIEIKYYVQFEVEKFSVFNRNSDNNLGFTIIDKYKYIDKYKHFMLSERVNNKKLPYTNEGNLKSIYDDIIGKQIDLYYTLNDNVGKKNVEISDYEITKFKEEVKELFKISSESFLKKKIVEKYEFIDHSLNKIGQNILRQNILGEIKKEFLLKLIKYLNIKDTENMNYETILEKIFTHENIYNLKKVLVVLDSNFNLKRFDQTKFSCRRLSGFEKENLKSSNFDFDFYSELVKINNILDSFRKNLNFLEILNILNDENQFRDFNKNKCNYHIIKSVNYDIEKQETIPINITSIIGCKYKGFNKINEKTSIDFITDGSFESELYKKLQKNNNTILDKYSCVLIDEAHERTIPTELILSLFQNKLLDNIKDNKKKKKKKKIFKLLIFNAKINKNLFLNYFNTKFFFYI